MENDITISEAIDNAIEFLEACGVTGGDVVDDLCIVARKLRTKHVDVGKELLGA